jgi:prevent-host-death family protein
MKQVNIREAKTQFSRLLRRAAADEEITIANRGVPVARLVPVPAPPPKPMRKLGLYGGTIKVPDDFDAPLPDEILDLFEGRKPKKRKKS